MGRYRIDFVKQRQPTFDLYRQADTEFAEKALAEEWEPVTDMYEEQRETYINERVEEPREEQHHLEPFKW